MPPRYKVTDLSAGVDAVAVHPADINDHGQVVGKLFRGERYWNGISIWHAFVWQNGELSLLPTLGGTISIATAINDHGHIVGFSRTDESTDPAAIKHAYVIRDDAIKDLGTLGGLSSFAYGINEAGQIVGQSLTADDLDAERPNVRACVWNADGIKELEDLAGQYTCAADVNAAGRIVGTARLPSRQRHAVCWEEGRVHLLGPPESTSSSATAVNQAGDIVGSSYIPGGLGHAALWLASGEIIDLGILGFHTSLALAVNDHRQVVGQSGLRPDTMSYPAHAFLWQDGNLYDLDAFVAPDSGWQLFEATAINNAGQIIGRGLFGDEVRAFLLTPE